MNEHVESLNLAGAGIALAIQGVLSNVVAGLTIIFTRPFRVGEYISISGVEGGVESIGVFKTTLNHPDMSKVVIPNRKRTQRTRRKGNNKDKGKLN
jgi:small conductance mechanosensitive channel